MTSRERIRRAIHFQHPDRLPHFLPDGGAIDLLWLWPPRLPPQKDWTRDGDKDWMTDEWGAVRYRAAGGVYGFGEVFKAPIEDITRQAEYELPERNNPADYGAWRKAIAENAVAGDPKYVLGVTAYGNFERSHMLVGLTELMIALYEHPEHVHALLDRLCDKQCECIRLCKEELGCDGVMYYDDWGLQDRLILSLEHVREFFLPRYRRAWDLAHELGMDVWMHSCGYTLDILPVLRDAGLNVAQLDQQENMGLDRLNAVLGGTLAFWCPVDIQRTMVEGSEDDIELYIKRMIETLGGHHGGLVSKTYPTPDDVRHEPVKIAAACRAFRKYERLGL
jgi:uroporphyrinogen decarboxylase